MIGHLIDAYARGRSDARAGRGKRMPPEAGPARRLAYRTGYMDERREMHRVKRLPQPALFDSELAPGDQ